MSCYLTLASRLRRRWEGRVQVVWLCNFFRNWTAKVLSPSYLCPVWVLSLWFVMDILCQVSSMWFKTPKASYQLCHSLQVTASSQGGSWGPPLVPQLPHFHGVLLSWTRDDSRGTQGHLWLVMSSASSAWDCLSKLLDILLLADFSQYVCATQNLS